MPRPYVYLCGPIDNRTFTDASSWRNRAAQLLAPEFDVLDPLRKSDELEQLLEARQQRTYDPRTSTELFTDAEIVVGDLMDIDRSRAVIRYYDFAGEGSPMEAFYAMHVKQIPVVVVNASPRPVTALSPWLRYHAVKIVPTIDDAVCYVKSRFLYPGEEALSITPGVGLRRGEDTFLGVPWRAEDFIRNREKANRFMETYEQPTSEGDTDEQC